MCQAWRWALGIKRKHIGLTHHLGTRGGGKCTAHRFQGLRDDAEPRNLPCVKARRPPERTCRDTRTEPCKSTANVRKRRFTSRGHEASRGPGQDQQEQDAKCLSVQALGEVCFIPEVVGKCGRILNGTLIGAELDFQEPTVPTTKRMNTGEPGEKAKD